MVTLGFNIFCAVNHVTYEDLSEIVHSHRTKVSRTCEAPDILRQTPQGSYPGARKVNQ